MFRGTLEDYLTWRGDLSFEERPFNIVDNLMFSYLSYSYFRGLATKEEKEKGLPIKEYIRRLEEQGGYKTDMDIYAKEDFLKKVMESKRYKDVLIVDYVDTLSGAKESQFSAMTFHFGKNEAYIAFRGTDDTIIGWKEDFMLSFKKTAAQTYALHYLEKQLTDKKMTYYVGGHSKGGNLAIYAASMLKDDKQRDMIKTIYTNDGPGLCSDVIDNKVLEKIERKTVRIIPEYSIIGMLFPPKFPNLKIVASKEKGISQHDLLSWEVQADELVTVKSLNPDAARIDDAISSWLDDVPLADREQFANDLFKAFTFNGKVKTLSGVKKQSTQVLEISLSKVVNKNETTRRTAMKLPFHILFGKGLMKVRYAKPVDFVLHNSLPLGILLAVVGILFITLPTTAAPLLLGILLVMATLADLASTVYILYLNHFHFKSQVMRIYIFIILLVFTIAVFVNPTELETLSDMIFGIVCMIICFSIFGSMLNDKKTPIIVIITLIECLILLGAGIYFICVPTNIALIYLVLGAFSLGIGVVKIYKGIYKLVKG